MQPNMLLEHIEKVLNNDKDRIIIQCDEKHYTRKEFLQRCQGWWTEFQEFQLNPGTTVIVCVDDEIDFIAIWLALWKHQCIPVPLEIKVSIKEMEQAIESSHGAVVITSKDFSTVKTKEYYQKSEIVQEISYIFTKYQSEQCQNTAASLYFYTSGTTGTPKCVMFSHDAMYHNIADLAVSLKLSAADVFFTPLSPMLPAALTTAVLPILLKGGRLILTKKQLPRSIAKKVKESQATIFFGVPYLYELLNDSVGQALNGYYEKVRICLSSSAYLSRNLIEQFYQLSGQYIRSIYCSSEAGLISYNNSDIPEIIFNTVGQACGNTSIQLVYNSSADIGEIWISGNHLSLGYLNQEQLQAEVYSDGKVRTGDLGAIDQQGNITLLGRIQDTINVSGYLVVPLEVEAVIAEMDGIKEVVVYGSDDNNFKQIVTAKIVLKRFDLTVDQIIDYCAKRLSHYKVPQKIEFVEELPKSRYGKKIRLFQEDNQ